MNQQSKEERQRIREEKERQRIAQAPLCGRKTREGVCAAPLKFNRISETWRCSRGHKLTEFVDVPSPQPPMFLMPDEEVPGEDNIGPEEEEEAVYLFGAPPTVKPTFDAELAEQTREWVRRK